jgi:hypothetical protein
VPERLVRAGVDDCERAELGLQLGEGGRLGRLGSQPVLQGLLEALDFALGLGVIRLAVLLRDAEVAQLGFQGVAATPAAGEPDSKDQPIVRQRRGRRPIGLHRGAERGQDGGAGDPGVGGERERGAGVVI